MYALCLYGKKVQQTLCNFPQRQEPICLIYQLSLDQILLVQKSFLFEQSPIEVSKGHHKSRTINIPESYLGHV